jgi:hypothetical protein
VSKKKMEDAPLDIQTEIPVAAPVATETPSPISAPAESSPPPEPAAGNGNGIGEKRRPMAPPASAPAESSPPPEPAAGNGSGNGEKKRPVASFRCTSDRSTSLEVSVWGNLIRNPDGTTWTQFSISLHRSYKHNDGCWYSSTSWKGHDVPVLLFLLGKAHDWVLQQRTHDAPVPF